MSANLDELMLEVLPTVPVANKWPSGASKGIVTVKYTHDAMIDAIIANPIISQNELACLFGYSASWVSQIITSDSFQARLAERKEEIVDPTIRATTEDRIKALVARSLEILMEKLNRPTALIPDNLAIRTLELASRAAGYGAKDVNVQNNQVNMTVHLEQLGGNLTNLLQRKKAEVIDIGDENE